MKIKVSQMKIFILLSVLLAVSYAEKSIHWELGDIFESLQERKDFKKDLEDQCREKFTEEFIREFGVDSLDPLVIKDKRIQFSATIEEILKEECIREIKINSLLGIEDETIQLESPFELDLNISQRIDGIPGFEITNYEFHLAGLTIGFTINWPQLTLHTDYGLLLNIMEQDFFGNGYIDASLENFAISWQFQFTNKLIDGKLHIQLEELSTELSVGSYDFEITGLMNDDEISDLVSDVIIDRFPIAMHEVEKRISAEMTEYIEGINEWIVNNGLIKFI